MSSEDVGSEIWAESPSTEVSNEVKFVFVLEHCWAWGFRVVRKTRDLDHLFIWLNGPGKVVDVVVAVGSVIGVEPTVRKWEWWKNWGLLGPHLLWCTCFGCLLTWRAFERKSERPRGRNHVEQDNAQTVWKYIGYEKLGSLLASGSETNAWDSLVVPGLKCLSYPFFYLFFPLQPSYPLPPMVNFFSTSTFLLIYLFILS